MRFHIIGIGPMGSLLSYHLRRVMPPTHSITLIHKTRRQEKELMANGGVMRVECGGVVSSVGGFQSDVFVASNTASTSNNVSSHVHVSGSRSDSDTIESLFVTTKAHHTLSAVQRLLPRLSRNSTIVLLQNGMGIYEQLIHDVFRNPEQRPHFILALNTHGAWFKGYHNVVHAGVGHIQFGIVPDPAGRQFEAPLLDENVPRSDRQLSLDDIASPSDDPSFSRYHSLRNTVAALCSLEHALHAQWHPITYVQVAMRRRLVVNAVISSLSAIMGCRNGDIFTTMAARRVMQRVCQEAADVFTAQIQAETQVWLDSLPEGNTRTENVPVGRLSRALTKSMLQTECLRVAELTKGNVSSMLSDIRRGKRTEVDFVTGYLLNLGSTYNVQMPATATLLNLVKMRSAIALDQIL